MDYRVYYLQELYYRRRMFYVSVQKVGASRASVSLDAFIIGNVCTLQCRKTPAAVQVKSPGRPEHLSHLLQCWIIQLQ